MAGWMVTVAIMKADGGVGHEMYAVAIEDPAQAIDAALKFSAGCAAVVNGSMDGGAVEAAGLRTGEVSRILDDQCDPILGRATRH
ncbi:MULTISPECIES: hypothetical protein [Bradyrhizobium]|uniref:Uncharacterized protein n=2 Tax=Bradyrhizobium TaxID=374 RepID=A0A939M8B0_9BRAD|nr:MULTISPECIES: hypothetical protein [Bradyrhizobium]UEM14375.1 hypothetical protein J4G43_009020 [Bradyrhizobium barranii subsp. barranii]WLB90270.1 hypothetical protein QIH91_06870 [Bradyrhizobium japonicum USDA 135]GLR97883.1 hypothetical protein GCM10007858_55250 [Bradyrhizobium liaoningense]